MIMKQPSGDGKRAAVLSPVELLGDNALTRTRYTGGDNLLKIELPAQPGNQ